ncbi:Hypothetical predicted protein [Pelobates cultripes]|uniref:Secreted protein n=1 Tax=Pelobates cultripes TaxID=61616 RepID=A0AAD1RC75_PELCU|nr:Hypothetical predicted protein [Pelobates cultripes]
MHPGGRRWNCYYSILRVLLFTPLAVRALVSCTRTRAFAPVVVLLSGARYREPREDQRELPGDQDTGDTDSMQVWILDKHQDGVRFIFWILLTV